MHSFSQNQLTCRQKFLIRGFNNAFDYLVEELGGDNTSAIGFAAG